MNPYFNENTVLDYIKQSLGVPYNIIEFSDDELISNIILNHNYLKEFSQYFPKEERVYLNESNNEMTIKQANGEITANDYKYNDYNHNQMNRWIIDCDNEILGVKNIHVTSINTINTFYNDFYSFSNPIESATNNLMRGMAEMKISHRFYYPNIVEVLGFPRNIQMLAILDVVHDKDLTSIPSSLHHSYNRLCLYNTANALLSIRNKYSEISTPFTNINLNIEMLQALADKKQELIQEFKSVANYNSRGLGIFVC